MAKLINGNGNLAIYAEEDADWFGSIFGNTTAITGIGNQFAYSLLDANTVGVQDGVIISKEGRRVQLNANEIDEFDIPTGAQGTTSYYIIGYHLITDETSAQTCETFVELMDNGTDTIPEGTFRGGDDDVYISLYRVKQVDLAITQLTLLLPKVSTISEINQHLTDLETANTNRDTITLLNDVSGTVSHVGTNKELSQSVSNFKKIIVTFKSTSSSNVYRAKEVNVEFLKLGRLINIWYDDSYQSANGGSIQYIDDTHIKVASETSLTSSYYVDIYGVK